MVWCSRTSVLATLWALIPANSIKAELGKVEEYISQNCRTRLGSVEGVHHVLELQGVGGDYVLGHGGRGVVDTGLSWDDEVVRI